MSLGLGGPAVFSACFSENPQGPAWVRHSQELDVTGGVQSEAHT